MRRGPGVKGLKKQKEEKVAIKQKGEELEDQKIEHVKQQLDFFRSELEVFAQKHKKEINKNPVFRGQFQKMCRQVGVDPLASSKGFWAKLLGVGDFYYELAVQLIDVCLATQAQNGGMISLDELQSRVMSKRGKLSQEISRDDIKQAIGKTAQLGNGFRVVVVGSREVVMSVPMEMNKDHMAILEMAEGSGMVRASEVQSTLKWPQERVERSMRVMLSEGMVWVDQQHPSGEIAYWFPSLHGKSHWREETKDLL